MFLRKYSSKERKMVKNGLTIILLTGWQKNELSVLESALRIKSIQLGHRLCLEINFDGICHIDP